MSLQPLETNLDDDFFNVYSYCITPSICPYQLRYKTLQIKWCVGWFQWVNRTSTPVLYLSKHKVETLNTNFTVVPIMISILHKKT